ncbi:MULTISPECIES: glycosyltransferase family 2 protein [Halorussus]|uniref:glycosyltransferase family 2 protein n=1 Tax=Halorussus TaxID=1070314 RepID=UPI000E212451|nr:MULTISPECIES: glycosyltransferase family 2 protein [Halorussus]NHN61478.1 glycosyltransferase family 2 protein [Halorussus sp. JP-T4]
MSLQVAEGGRTAQSVAESLGSAHVVAGIPAYNEESAIGSTVLGVKRWADEVVVVDDGSTDRTPALLAEADVTVLRHDTNRGKGAAVRTLFAHARRTECDALVMLDADGQHDPADVPALAEPVVEGDADMVIGSRYLSGDALDETPIYRRFGQLVLDYCTSRVTGSDLTDTQSGYRAFSPECLERLSITTDGMGVESEMIDSATTEELTITERAIDARYDDLEGQTHNPVKHGLAVMLFLVRLLKRRRPTPSRSRNQ